MAKGHGGKRAGAGRPVEEGKEATKVARVSVRKLALLDKVEELEAILRDWDERLDSASASSPRYEKAREMMAEIKSVMGGLI